MRVFIAEKPSLAQAIFVGLGGNPSTQKKNGYYQQGNDIVTWCFGHMLELFDPDDYDPKYKKWVLDDLPIKTTYPPKLKVKSQSKKQFTIIKQLIGQSTSVVNASDPDDEGQLLVDEILTYCAYTKPVERVLVADLNVKAVQRALNDMQPNHHFAHLSQSALARSLSDQMFGYNLTRAYTVKAREKGHQGVLNIGRVISAILGLVNTRTLANENHTASYYYTVLGTFGDIEHAKYKPSEHDNVDDKGRLLSELDAHLIAEGCQSKTAHISAIDTKQVITAPPAPYNLSALQQVCAKKHRFSAAKTLKVCQSLYETHKLLTYPRSDNRFLSDEHYTNRDNILVAITQTSSDFTATIAHCDTNVKHKAFNSAKIEAHHAIIPTEKDGTAMTLTKDERIIYNLVALNFIGLFYPASSRDKTRASIVCENQCFMATQSVVTQSGWEVLGDTEQEQDKPIGKVDLRQIQQGEELHCHSTKVDKKKTLPEKYFVESTLLAAMTRAAKWVQNPDLRKQLELKDKGNNSEHGSIGTEATRAGLLEKVAGLKELITITKEKGYKEDIWKTTSLGQEFCALLPKEIIAPDISAIWAGRQAQIKNGDMTIQDFIALTDQYLSQQVDHVKTHGVNISVPDYECCPVCKVGKVQPRTGKNGKFWACNQYPTCKQTFPDVDNKPALKKAPPKVKKFEVSKTEFCKQCGAALIRRAAKTEGRFWWSCSGYPKCAVRFYDKDGKPDRDKGEI